MPVPEAKAFWKIIALSFLSLARTQEQFMGNTLIGNNEDATLSSFIMEFFRYQGVHNILLLDNRNQSGRFQSKDQKINNMMATHFLASNFYITIFNVQRFEGAHWNSSRNETSVCHKTSIGNRETTSEVHPSILKQLIKLTQTPNTPQCSTQFPLTSSARKSGILLWNIDAPNILRLLRWIAKPENYYFKTGNFWLLCTKDFSQLDNLDEEAIFLPPDSEVYLMTPSTLSVPSPCVDIFSLYKVTAKHSLKVSAVGRHLCNVNALRQALGSYGSPISYRQDLEGTVFNTGFVIAFPDLFSNIEDTTLRHIDTITKVNHRLTFELANKFNISFNTFQTDNWGWRKPNGSFDGLMGRFQRLQLDFAQMAVFMRTDRLLAVDFVAETYRIRAGMIFRQPPLSAVTNIFALPFDNYVWLSILFLIILIIAILGLELVFSPTTLQLDIWDCFVFVWGAMCQQGFYANVTNRSGRIIVFTTFVSALFLFTSFSANIVALLQSPSEAISTLSDLSQSPLEIGVQDTVYNKIFFNESTDPVTNHLYLKKIAPKGDNIYMRPIPGIQRMRKGLFAYQVELQAGYQIISETFSEPEKCGLMEIEPFQLPMIGIPTRKNFPYKELFRRQLRWQRETGLMKREELKWIPQKPKCEGSVGGFVSIGLTECRYALAIYGFGSLFGIFIFCLEVSLRYYLKILKKFHKNKLNPAHN